MRPRPQRGLGIVPEDLPWTVPQALLQRLAAVRYQGRPLIAEITRHPSRQTRFYDGYLALSLDEARLMKELVAESDTLDGRRFAQMPLASKQAVLDSLIDYYQFVADPKERSAGKVHPGYAKALAARYRLAPGGRQLATQSEDAPHAGRAPSWVQLGWLHGSGFGSAASLRIRPAYYDALDTGSGHVPYSVLAMGDLQLRVRAGTVRLQRLDLVAIESVNPGVTGLPGDRGGAWKLRAGAEPLRPGCDDCLVARLQGDIGVGRRLASKIFAAVYAGGAVQASRSGHGPGFVRTSGDVIVRPYPQVAVRLGYEHRVPVGGRQTPYGLGQAELRLALGSRGDLRIRHEQSGSTLTGIGLGIYW